MFENNIKIYEDAQRTIGFSGSFNSNAEEKRKHKRKIIWFNSNVDKIF